jgi:hypothetical protein
MTMGSANMRGWRRLGIVLSVFWFAGFGWFLLNERLDDFNHDWKMNTYICDSTYERKRYAPEFQYLSEEAANQVAKDFHNCLEREGAKTNFRTPLWGIVVIDALSIGAVWLLAWIVLAVGRWIAAGFRQA